MTRFNYVGLISCQLSWKLSVFLCLTSGGHKIKVKRQKRGCPHHPKMNVLHHFFGIIKLVLIN